MHQICVNLSVLHCAYAQKWMWPCGSRTTWRRWPLRILFRAIPLQQLLHTHSAGDQRGFGQWWHHERHLIPWRSSARRSDHYEPPGDGKAHGHVKHRNNPDGTTDYEYARDVEGNEYNVWFRRPEYDIKLFHLGHGCKLYLQSLILN